MLTVHGRLPWLSVLVLFLGATAAGWAKIPVILSTDIGNEIDDQWAATYMLTNPDFEVLGVISAHAPSLPDPSAHYTFEVLKDLVEVRLGMSVHPPLFEGSSLPLAGNATPRMNAGVEFIVNTSRKFSSANRLTVLTIGAATDVASAVLSDPTIADRIRVIAMGFNNSKNADEYNVQNDVRAWQVLLGSRVPLVIGPGDVCRADLALDFDQAKKLISSHGPVGAWLWEEYKAWYFRNVKPLRRDDFSKPWYIWDIITLAYLEGMTSQESMARERLNPDFTLTSAGGGPPIQWITHVDSQRLWTDFLKKLDFYERTHAIAAAGMRP
jgi:inosine-uridine nucleoside N-ribohydrolase